jgi:AcrR family transcriptional regulator
MDARTRILDAALGLLAKGGAQELTQPRICRAAGVRQSHLTYYFPTIHDLLQGVAKHTLDAMTAELAKRDDTHRPASFLDAIVATAADRRRMRMVLGLVTTADREPKLKPRMRGFLDEIREGIARMLQAGGLAGTPDQVAFIHSVVVGQGILQLARDNPRARDEARRILAMAVELLRQGEGSTAKTRAKRASKVRT